AGVGGGRYPGRVMTSTQRPARSAYLDHAATTPMVPAAVAAMTQALSEVGNASSLHSSGRRARRLVEEARESIAEALGARPSEVLFTGGGTEASSQAVKGIGWGRHAERPARRRVRVAAVEDDAVLGAAQWLADDMGGELALLPVDAGGGVSPQAVRTALEA